MLRSLSITFAVMGLVGIIFCSRKTVSAEKEKEKPSQQPLVVKTNTSNASKPATTETSNSLLSGVKEPIFISCYI